MPPIDSVTTGVYRFPTPQPEADGTLTWDSTVAVTVTLGAGHERGLGWTYGSPAAAAVVKEHLRPVLLDSSPADITDLGHRMRRECRNAGVPGITSYAISAVDIALWDLKARLLEVPLSDLLGKVREASVVYGSGGFVNLTEHQLAEQIAVWAAAGCTAVKIKIGAEFDRDLARIALTSTLAGPRTRIMVDANGAYSPAAARRMGRELDRLGVIWFEEPVTSDDVPGLGSVRDSVHCDVAAGEYVDSDYAAARLIGAVDCLQLDVTRCGGYTGFLRCAAVAAAAHRDVSAHCAPALHAVVAAAVPRLRHIEWFADHVRLEPLLVDGSPTVSDGRILPRGNTAVPYGHGMTLAEGSQSYRL